MEPGRKEPSSERTVGTALEDEAGSIYGREADGRWRGDIPGCLWRSPRVRIFNRYAFGSGSTQEKKNSFLEGNQNRHP